MLADGEMTVATSPTASSEVFNTDRRTDVQRARWLPASVVHSDGGVTAVGGALITTIACGRPLDQERSLCSEWGGSNVTGDPNKVGVVNGQTFQEYCEVRGGSAGSWRC